MQEEPFDRVLLLLMGGMILCAVALFCAEIWFNNDGQLFTVFSGLLTGFSGSFFTRLKPKEAPPSMPIPPKATVDVSTTVHQEPPKE